jgi:hypothetical protein
MPYRIAGIDVHKRKLALVVADVEVEEECQFERRWYGSNPEQLRALSEWLIVQQVEEVVMESTAQYWKPVAIRLAPRSSRPSCRCRAGTSTMPTASKCAASPCARNATLRGRRMTRRRNEVSDSRSNSYLSNGGCTWKARC